MISREKFKNPNFNEIEFYLSVKDLDLEIIQQDIKSIQGQVLDQVQDYVNQEYLNFLSLGRDLDFIQDELYEYSQDFYKILDSVQNFDQNLLNSSSEALKKLQENSCKEIQKEIFKFERLNKVNIIDIASKDLLKGIVLYCEARDFTKFSPNVPCQDDFDQVKQHLCLEIKKELEKIFTCFFKSEEFDQLIKLCLGISMLDRFDILSSCFRSVMIDCWILESLALPRFQDLSERRSNSQTIKDENLLGEWLEEFLVFIKDKVLPILRLTDKMCHGRDFSLLTDAVWPALVDQVDQMTNIKNPAHLKEFHANYSACMGFIKDFEKLFTDQKQIGRWKSQKSFVDFMKMWQLSVYYQIRIKEIQEILENSLGLKTVESKYCGISIKASETLLNGIEALWAPHVFLYGLQYRALKATFNFISIYLNFISDMLKEDTRDTSRSDDTFITLLLTLYNDLDLITEPLLSLASSWPIPENLKDQTQTQVENLWKKDYVPVQADIESKVVNLIFVKCNEMIKQVRIIPSQFRGTQKETPTKASVFLAGILAPISNFKKIQRSSIVTVISQKITSQVISRYEDAVSETLNSVSNIEAGLRRFKRTKNVSDVSDEDKMRRQLEIDAEEFKRLVLLLDTD